MKNLDRFERITVQAFNEALTQEQKKLHSSEDRTIVRLPGNPMIRGAGEIMGSQTASQTHQ